MKSPLSRLDTSSFVISHPIDAALSPLPRPAQPSHNEDTSYTASCLLIFPTKLQGRTKLSTNTHLTGRPSTRQSIYSHFLPPPLERKEESPSTPRTTHTQSQSQSTDSYPVASTLNGCHTAGQLSRRTYGKLEHYRSVCGWMRMRIWVWVWV